MPGGSPRCYTPSLIAFCQAALWDKITVEWLNVCLWRKALFYRLTAVWLEFQSRRYLGCIIAASGWIFWSCKRPQTWVRLIYRSPLPPTAYTSSGNKLLPHTHLHLDLPHRCYNKQCWDHTHLFFSFPKLPTKTALWRQHISLIRKPWYEVCLLKQNREYLREDQFFICWEWEPHCVPLLTSFVQWSPFVK